MAATVMLGRQVDTSRFYQRFKDGTLIDPQAPRITTRKSETLFPQRDEGLDILLINPPIREWSYPNVMPLGQGYIGAVSVMDGHKLDVLDLNALRREPIKSSAQDFDRWIEEKIAERLAVSEPDVIGIGAIITQYARVRLITRLLKRLMPDVPVVLGGGISSCMPEFMLRRLPIDVAMQEEGDVTFSEVLHRIERKEPLDGVRGIVWRRKLQSGESEIVNNGLRPSLKSAQDGLDGLPWPLRTRWPIDEVYKRNPVGHLNWKNKWKDGSVAESGKYSVTLIGSRGCPYSMNSCDYCYASYLGSAYRLRGVKDLVSEMAYLQDEYQASYVHFQDDLLITNPQWSTDFVRELEDWRSNKGLAVEWGASCRTNIIANDIRRSRKEGRPNILELAYQVGMRQVIYGVETGSPTILKSIDKSGQTVDAIRLAVTETQRVMGYADCSFIIGSPGETRETVRETVALCKEIGLRPEVFFFTTAYPGTKFWKLALEKGLIRKAVTGQAGPADEDMIEEYCLRLGEQGEAVRTNFSDLPDQEIVDLSWWAINELGAQNTVRHPHTGETESKRKAQVQSQAGA